jgi:hypothetical protein
MMDYRNIGEFPHTSTQSHTVRDILTYLSDQVEPEPEELQRGVVLSNDWAQGIVASVLLRVNIPTFTWSRQAKPYEAKNIYGEMIDAIYKNLDSLQRYTGLSWFHLGKIRVPELFPPITWNGEQVFLAGMSVPEIDIEQPGLLADRFYNVQIHIDKYGEGDQFLTPRQETYLFKYVLNNQNAMNSQQWRNPTNSAVASAVRQDARLKLTQIPLFKNNLFSFGNGKMAYDEFYAMIIHFLLHGPHISLTKNPLDEMYESPSLETKLTSRSTEYGNMVNVRTYGKAYAKFMYNILKDKEFKALMDKSYSYSLLYYTHIHMKSGINNLFNYEKLRDQFFDYHLELITPPKGYKGRTEFRDCLSSNSIDKMTRAMEIWEEKLNVSTELKYVIVRDGKRTFTKQEIAMALKRQGGIDPIDGLPLSLTDAIGGHNVAWSKGGLTILDNCIAIRKEYNDDMGTKTLEEYKEELETIS